MCNFVIYMQPAVTDFGPTFQCSLQFNNVKAGTYAISCFTSIYTQSAHTQSITYLIGERHHVYCSNQLFSSYRLELQEILSPSWHRLLCQESKSKKVPTNFCFLFLIKSLSLQLYRMYKVAVFKLRNTTLSLNAVSGQMNHQLTVTSLCGWDLSYLYDI